MPFALGTAWEFTQVGKQFKAIAFSINLRINQYLDDWLNQAQARLDCQLKTTSLLHLAIFLGFVPILQKSLEQTQTFPFLGEHYDLAQSKEYPTQKGLLKIADKATSFLSLETTSA